MLKLKSSSLWLVLCLCVTAGAHAQAPAATGPAPLSRQGITSVMRCACDYQLIQQGGKRDNGWVRATFYTGVLALYSATHDEKYLNAALRWADLSQWTPSPRDPVFADNQCCIQVYADLARLQNDKTKLAPSIAAEERLLASAKSGREQWWWCDSLYMAPAGLVRMSAVTGDPRYAAKMNALYWDTTDFLYDKDEKLFFRDKSYFNKKTEHGKPVFWARGNGWVMGGLARILDDLPANDPNRPRFVKLHQEMSAKIASLQGEDGLWRTSLLDPEQFPSPETSGSAFYTYALAWGINHHTLDRKTYLPIVRKAWTALGSKVNVDGRLGYVQGVGAAPGPVRPDATQEYAVGALLLAGNEMMKLADAPKPSGH